MKQKKNKKSTKTIIISVVVGFFILFVLISLGKKPQPLTQQYLNQPQIQNAKFKTHTSQDLKISFQYLREWNVDEKNGNVLITSYRTFIGQGKKATTNQVRLNITRASLCQKTLDEDVLLGGCGEGKNTKNEVLSKDIKKVLSGSFIVYKIKYPTGQLDTSYYLQHEDVILQISKQPDPSQFEKEFEEIVNSITFL